MDPIDNVIENLITTDSAKIVDDSLKGNAEFADRAGLEIRVTRVYDGVGLSRGRVCQWCKDRECRNATLQEAYDIGAFQRHPGCECIIEYTSTKGTKSVQTRSGGRDSWVSRFDLERRKEYGTKKDPVTPGERIIAAAVQQQLKVNGNGLLAESIIDNHEALKNISPAEMKTMLEIAGYDIQPLGNKSDHFRNIQYEDGGGYRVSFRSGHLRYHPEGGLHRIAYWTVSSGKRGKHQYGMDGKEVDFSRDITESIK
ncbi:MAG: hypothetical protein IJK56_11075 [Firmicutes bacterium]|nr:hypothetical protein [Bacillota bacterium]